MTMILTTVGCSGVVIRENVGGGGGDAVRLISEVLSA